MQRLFKNELLEMVMFYDALRCTGLLISPMHIHLCLNSWDKEVFIVADV